MMSWPMRLRAMSFAITFGVVAMEVAMVVVPVELILWFAGVASVSRLISAAIAIIGGYAAAIAIYSHAGRIGIARRAINGGD